MQSDVNISFPESMRQWVEERVEVGGYGTVSEYIRSLVRDDQRREARERLDRTLVEAQESGEPTEMTADDWKAIRDRVRARAAAAAKAKK